MFKHEFMRKRILRYLSYCVVKINIPGYDSN